tara:strand:- start:1169 stop:1798 length:630 start_codon:yes stop_codon:yes gene_type:complete
MALRILPFRQYDDNDVVNLYAMENAGVNDATTDAGSGDAGVFVNILDGDFNKDPVTYQTNSYLGDSSFPYLGSTEMYPEVNLKVTPAASGTHPLGLTLLQTAKNDENGEKLLYNPTKATELQALLPGQAVPVATKGIFTLATEAFEGAANLYTIGSGVRISDQGGGKITGCHHHHHGHIGHVLGTGSRTSEGPTTDQFAGDYLVIGLKI